MEEYTQVTLNEWMEWKEDIRKKLAEAAGNFVYIGYRLKQIRDSGMYDGCSDIFGFAQKEYGLGKSTVSRFIAINEKFSEGGNSLELKEEYRAIGSSKLAEMLTLSDSECQLITERTTVKEIRELKQFVRQQVAEDVEEAVQYTPLQKCIIAFLGQQDKKDVLDYTMDLLMGEPDERDIKDVVELINPGEYTTFKKGIIFLFLYNYTGGVKYKSLMESEPVSMSWSEFLREITQIYGEYYKPGERTWINFYGEPTPEGKLQSEPEKAPEKELEKFEETQQNQAVATSQQTPVEEEKSENEEKENRSDTGHLMTREKVKKEKTENQSTGVDGDGTNPCSGEIREETGSTEDTEGRDGAEKIIESIQKLGDEIDGIYGWDTEEFPTKEEIQIVRDNLKMILHLLEQLEEKIQEDKSEC